MTEPLSYTPQTAAAATGMSEDLIRKAAKAKKLRTRRTGEGGRTGRIVILRADLQAWLESLSEDAS